MTIIDENQSTFASLLTEAEELSDEFCNSLPDRVDPAEITLISKLPFKAIALRDVLLHRAAELTCVACDLYKSRRVVSAYIMTRSLIETTALLYRLKHRVNEVVQTKQVGDVDEFLIKASFGTRNPDLGLEATNILTHIKFLDKNFSGILGMYDELCEYAHPNWYGVHAAYSKLDVENRILYLGSNVSGVPIENGLAYHVSSLKIFKHFYNQMNDAINDFVQICNEDIRDNPDANLDVGSLV